MALFGLLGCGTSLLLMAAVAWMNYRFFLRLAPDEGQIPALGSIAVEILLACFSPLIGWGWANQRRLFAMVVTGAVALFAGTSFVSALSFVMEARARSALQREAFTAEWTLAKAQLMRLQKRQAAQPEGIPLALASANFEQVRRHPRWVSTRECQAVAGIEVRQWCETARTAQVEQARAAALVQLDADLTAAAQQLAELERRASAGTLDALVAILAGMLGQPSGHVHLALSLLGVLAIQVGGCFGLAIGSVPVLAYLERRRLLRTIPEAGAHLVWNGKDEPLVMMEKDDGAKDVATQRGGGQRRRRS
jgi:hypothetical protein